MRYVLSKAERSSNHITETFLLDFTFQMPKIKTSRTKPPPGFEKIEETLNALNQKMRDGKFASYFLSYVFLPPMIKRT